MMLIDISYFEIRDVESGHRISSKRNARESHNSSQIQDEEDKNGGGFLVTRILD